MHTGTNHPQARLSGASAAALCGLLALATAGPAFAQASECPPNQMKLNLPDQELNIVIDLMAEKTGRNFIYDDRVRGRVTIVSPACVTLEEAYAVFESVLQVKGFTTVRAPGGSIKIIPLREAKETNVETVRGAPPSSDRFITRLIPLRYIDAEAISNTLKPLVSKDASMVAYAPTNTIILTDSGTNISRILDILRDIDVETYKEELSVVHLRHADAATLADQLSEIFFAEVSGAGGAQGIPAIARQRRALQPVPGGVPQAPGDAGPGSHARIITDARTNSLLILASRQRTAEIKEAIVRLDVKAEGGGRIHVYRLKHADAEELATTLAQLLGGQSGAPASGGNVSISGGAPVGNLRAAVTELSEGGVVVTPDAPTNSLVIQASVEGFNAISEVIAKLDTPRPQVLVEALIVEVDVSDGTALGFTGLARVFGGDNNFTIGSLSDGKDQDSGVIGGTPGPTDSTVTPELLQSLLTAAAGSSFVAGGNFAMGDTLIQALIRASAGATGTNVLSAPHILTLDNEQAEIKVGNNIPIITSRVESAQGTGGGGLASSVNVERLDVGITLRVTPQISEGDSLRLKLYEEITGLANLSAGTVGSVADVGPSLTSRKIENSVIVSDHETVVIGGLIDETNIESETKVPWFGDIPILGWLFKTTDDSVRKTNLLIFLTPHIIRTRSDHNAETIRKREEMWQSSEDALQLSRRERKEADALAEQAEENGVPVPDYSGHNPVRTALRAHRERYPVERMSELEAASKAEREAAAQADAGRPEGGPRYEVLAATFGDEGAAMATLQQLIDAGHDGTLTTEQRSGTVLYEIHLGPFDTAAAAEDKAAAIAEAFGLAPKVMLLPEPKP